MLHRLALAALLGTLALPAGARERLVLVPFERVARSSASRDVLMPALAAALLAKGYDVVAGPDVEEFLRKRRIRWLDSLTPARTAELLSTFDAGGAVLGTILSWAPDRIDPEVAVAARVLGRDGTVLWSDLAGLSISETEGALGLGKARGMDELARRAVDRLVAALPARKLAPVRVARSAGLEKLPCVFRDRDRIGARLRICVLPLENHSWDRDPPRVLAAVLQHGVGAARRIAIAGVDLEREHADPEPGADPVPVPEHAWELLEPRRARDAHRRELPRGERRDQAVHRPPRELVHPARLPEAERALRLGDGEAGEVAPQHRPVSPED